MGAFFIYERNLIAQSGANNMGGQVDNLRRTQCYFYSRDVGIEVILRYTQDLLSNKFAQFPFSFGWVLKLMDLGRWNPKIGVGGLGSPWHVYTQYLIPWPQNQPIINILGADIDIVWPKLTLRKMATPHVASMDLLWNVEYFWSNHK